MTDPATANPYPSVQSDTDYSLSETTKAAAQAMLSLAALAPGMSEAELRVALYLASIQDPQHRTCRASSRQIEAATRVARSNVKKAIDSLTQRSLIATRQGTAKTASAYRLNFTQTTALRGGVTATPPPQFELPGVGSQQAHPFEPVRAWVGLQQAHPSKPVGPLDIDSPEDSLIDRVLKARPGQFEEAELSTVRSYAYKWLTLQRGQAAAHPPDLTVIAQIITAAGGAGAAQNFIFDNCQDRQAETCGYLLSMILQRFHGIAPGQVKARRSQLKLLKKGKQAEAAPAEADQPDPQFSQDLLKQAIGGMKTLR